MAGIDYIYIITNNKQLNTNKMVKEFKYTTKEKVESLITNLQEQVDGDVNPLEYLKTKEELMRFTYSRDTTLPEEKALELVESFLHLFEQSEDYEICDSLVKTWPELLNNKNV